MLPIFDLCRTQHPNVGFLSCPEHNSKGYWAALCFQDTSFCIYCWLDSESKTMFGIISVEMKFFGRGGVFVGSSHSLPCSSVFLLESTVHSQVYSTETVSKLLL